MPEDPVNDTATSPRSFLKRYRAKVATLGVGVAVVAGVVTFNEVRGTAEPRTVDVTAAAPTVQVDLTRPFTGTPAADWPDGETGIVAPQATAIGPFSAQQVGDALTKVRQAVITSRLDRDVLEKHDIERYVSLLAKDSQKSVRPLFSKDPSEAHVYATRLADGFTLLPAAPKVHGKMWVEQGTRPGELVVRTNYVFAYAFNYDSPDKLADAMDIIVVDRWDVDYSVLTGKYTPSSQGLWPSRLQGFTYSMGCEALRAGFLAPAYSERRANAASSTPSNRGAYFDPSSELPASSTCD
ncbi:hypothetical protein JOF56_000171 [Kibdelosporangium banguiense]|uniref:Uncharacterized protein n=1 Tax=Kibdelosporangium banguiense TaxID=1365924 RepID=A0ABS4T5P5_9PSEU|nr:hypothetical protein [Kibdelosporangium banguiense]MBP2319786.1 hypothetical protein [Kibdelosporangium banguiense]